MLRQTILTSVRVCIFYIIYSYICVCVCIYAHHSWDVNTHGYDNLSWKVFFAYNECVLGAGERIVNNRLLMAT